jgi:pantetheine-phosphate adenylyltransferase
MRVAAIYAGSFDPWSFGHAFVFESALDIFSSLHICVAVNPAKKGILEPIDRSYLIAKSIAPCHWFEPGQQTYRVYDRLVVHTTYGLVADYARSMNINTMIRGLRSTSDFEAEFSLYFSNYAIFSDLKTWTVMCPPELLHCSSTYVRTVVGQPLVRFVGTGCLAQCMLLGRPMLVGELFDLLSYVLQDRASARKVVQPGLSRLSSALQVCFAAVISQRNSDACRIFESTHRFSFNDLLKSVALLYPDPFGFDEPGFDQLYELTVVRLEAAFADLNRMPLPDFAKQVIDCFKKGRRRGEVRAALLGAWGQYLDSNH